MPAQFGTHSQCKRAVNSPQLPKPIKQSSNQSDDQSLAALGRPGIDLSSCNPKIKTAPSSPELRPSQHPLTFVIAFASSLTRSVLLSAQHCPQTTTYEPVECRELSLIH